MNARPLRASSAPTLLALAAAAATAFAIHAYFFNQGINHTLGALIVIGSSAAMLIAALVVGFVTSLWRWLISGDWLRGPPIVSVLMRAATLSTGRELQAGRDCTDVLITPDVAGVEIRNWKAFDPAVEAGYRAARAALDKLKIPVTELRRRKSLREARAEALRNGGP